MCTLVFATGVPGSPGLTVVANRDEALDRPSSPPALRRRGGMRMLTPRDRRGGGTWIGVNEAGVFAGITNRFGLDSQPHHRSRGMLVFEALECRSARAAADSLRGLSPHRYNGFHLVVGDGEEAWLICHDGRRVGAERVEPGLYVVTERSFGAAPSDRLERLRGRIEAFDELSDRVRRELFDRMIEHDEKAPLESTCVHLPEVNYGTRSSTIVEIGTRWRFAHADGPPCTTAYREYTRQLRRLRSPDG